MREGLSPGRARTDHRARCWKDSGSGCQAWPPSPMSGWGKGADQVSGLRVGDRHHIRDLLNGEYSESEGLQDGRDTLQTDRYKPEGRDWGPGRKAAEATAGGEWTE